MTRGCPTGKRWVKMDLHLHAAEDPLDTIDYTAMQLLESAHQQGFEVLSITLHTQVLWDEELFRRAREFGILLIPGVEFRIEECDVLAYNLTPNEAEKVSSFEDLRKLRKERGESLLTIAPHPYYIFGGSMGGRLVREIDCFDGVEYCHFHTWGINFNWPAERVAKKAGLPMIATSDAHRLHAFGNHYTLVEIEGEPTVESVLQAIRTQRVKLHSPPLNLWSVLRTLFFIKVIHPIRKRQRKRRQAH